MDVDKSFQKKTTNNSKFDNFFPAYKKVNNFFLNKITKLQYTINNHSQIMSLLEYGYILIA